MISGCTAILRPGKLFHAELFLRVIRMLRGCLLALLLWASLAYGYYLWLGEIFESPASYIVPIVVGFLTMCCLGAWGNAWTAWRDLARLRRANDGTLPRNGQIIAVSGPIRPINQALPTPFTHRSCVICEYDIQRPAAGGSDTSPGSYYAGFMMIPCAIHTERGPVPLLGFPLVDKYSEVLRRDPQSSVNACEFLRNMTFEDRSGLKFVSIMSIFGELWSDADGMIFKNMRFTKKSIEDLYPPTMLTRLQQAAADSPQSKSVEDQELEDDGVESDDNDDPALQQNAVAAMQSPPRLLEKYIPINEEVTVFGVYQEMTGGIGPTHRGGKPSRLFRRTAAAQAQVSRRSITSNLVGGVIGFLVIHLFLFAGIWLYQHSEDGKRHQQRRAKQQPAALNLVPINTAYQRFVVIVPELES